MKYEQLIKGLTSWFKQHIGELRKTTGELGYQFSGKLLGFNKDTTKTNINEFFNRKELVDEYKKRINNRDLAKQKQTATIQNEINMIAGFHKCFAMRHHTRLNCYRDDTEQKRLRIPYNVTTSLARIESIKDQNG